jgi:hypothetical protein
VLNFTGASGNPPYYQSVGDGTVKDEIVELSSGTNSPSTAVGLLVETR